MREQTKLTQINARGELYRLTHELRQYLRWQLAGGATGSVPAPAEARAAFEALKKAQEQAKLAKLRQGLGFDKGQTPPAPAAAISPARPTKIAPSTAPQGARHREKAPERTGGATPWKTGGSRPTRRFQRDMAPPQTPLNSSAPEQSSSPQKTTSPEKVPSAKKVQSPGDSHKTPGTSTSRATDDAAMDAYAMQFSEVDEMPQDYHPGAQLYDQPPTSPTSSGQASATRKDPAAMSKAEKLEFLRNYMGDCRRCGLCEGRNELVFGQGNPEARLVFVAHAPDAIDDQSGKPLSDPKLSARSDGLFVKMLEAMGLGLDQVYISTIVKCRPPGDRAAHAAEIKECAPFLFKQLSVIQPRVIVALGELPSAVLADVELQGARHSKNFATDTRGTWFSWQGIPVMPTFHPADLLTARGAAQRRLKGQTWQDLQKVMKKLDL